MAARKVSCILGCISKNVTSVTMIVSPGVVLVRQHLECYTQNLGSPVQEGHWCKSSRGNEDGQGSGAQNVQRVAKRAVSVQLGERKAKEKHYCRLQLPGGRMQRRWNQSILRSA